MNFNLIHFISKNILSPFTIKLDEVILPLLYLLLFIYTAKCTLCTKSLLKQVRKNKSGEQFMLLQLII